MRRIRVGPVMAVAVAVAVESLGGTARTEDGGREAAPPPAREARPAEVRTTNRLVLIGGHEDKVGAETILREFVRLAGGDRARVLVITFPSKKQDEFVADYRRAFGRLGVRETRFLRVADREDADAEEAGTAAERATGVFFTGGSQSDIARWVRGSRLREALMRRGDEVVVAGTSAGAAVMAETMLSTGSSDECPRAGDIELEPGLGLIRGVIVDSHFGQRGRLGRMIAALAERPDQLGVGLGEDTAMVVEGGRLEVIGKGVVTVLDAGHLRHNNLGGLEDGEAIALVGLVVNTLPSGYRYDLEARALLDAAGGRKRARR